MHCIAAKAVAFHEDLQPEFAVYCENIVKNAKALAKGLVGRGTRIVTGGTDNHLMLLDLIGSGITGRELEARLEQANITVNKNTVPGDPESPFVTSGIRLGTPAVTTRGLNEADMDRIAEAITLMIRDPGNTDKARAIVRELTEAHPLEA